MQMPLATTETATLERADLSAVSIPTWSPLYHMPPHEFPQATRATILAKLPEGAVSSLLPPPLVATGDFLFVTWLRTGDWGADRDPAVHLMNMCFFLPCRYEDIRGKHCGLEYIDFDMGLTVGRELYSFPKKGGEFTWEKADTGVLDLECVRYGNILARSEITPLNHGSLDWESDHGAPDIGTSALQVRYLGREHGEPPMFAEVQQHAMGRFDLRESVPAIATLELFGNEHDPFGVLAEAEVLAARIDSYESTLAANEVLGVHRLR